MRERLTGRGTLFIKYILPLFFVAFFAFWMTGAVRAGMQGFREAWIMAAAAVPFMGIMAFLQWKLVRGHADEVVLEGDRLIVRKRGIEERIALSSIVNVDATEFTRPARITLRLRTPCSFGDEIRFFPAQ
ncbi:MAG: hypothetical protein HC783_06095 [Rhodobacteraceae bacterium]|nr:hypothetical protein [Paracoccaceae bacterium]